MEPEDQSPPLGGGLPHREALFCKYFSVGPLEVGLGIWLYCFCKYLLCQTLSAEQTGPLASRASLSGAGDVFVIIRSCLHGKGEQAGPVGEAGPMGLGGGRLCLLFVL